MLSAWNSYLEEGRWVLDRCILPALPLNVVANHIHQFIHIPQDKKKADINCFPEAGRQELTQVLYLLLFLCSEEGPSPLSVVTLVEEYCSIMSVFNLAGPCDRHWKGDGDGSQHPQIICVTSGCSHNIPVPGFSFVLLNVLFFTSYGTSGRWNHTFPYLYKRKIGYPYYCYAWGLMS